MSTDSIDANTDLVASYVSASVTATELSETTSKKRAAPEALVIKPTTPKKNAIAKSTKRAKVNTSNTATASVVATELAEVAKNPAGDGRARCPWAAKQNNPKDTVYHDSEWAIEGGFDRSNRYLFEMLILEGAQAGLSWNTILNKRDGYRDAYANFDYIHISDTFHSPAANERLMQANIVKNRLKVEASLLNARLFRELLEELYPDQTKPEDQNGFWCYLQQFRIGAAKTAKAAAADGDSPKKSKTQQGLKSGKVAGGVVATYDEEEAKQELTTFTTRSLESDRLCAALKKRGFKFVGSTICYTYLIAIGAVDDLGLAHFNSCFRHPSNE
ncbi:hypothetical protein DFQ27_001115 [Actinomortierella ambigua]|uniref:DNA-3-methyladenine glycosylase I n=1 Tax=Actinomortierella ambigua TaxID=1343610 RepID=A0A9P6QE19_9FUNG|nr:hypothetical protein DFQ27_001115 [Actinomortierella ambigua]